MQVGNNFVFEGVMEVKKYPPARNYHVALEI